MTRKFTLIWIILFFSCTAVLAQIGSEYVYDFLSLPSSARETALGGSLITIEDEDLSLAYANPALLNHKMHNRLVFSHNFLFDGIANGYFAYGHTLDSMRLNLHGGVKYINYGEIDQADVFGNLDGTVKANDISFHIGVSHKINERISLGVNLKYIRSQLAGYNSNGLASDIGVSYQDKPSNFSFALVLRNAGSEISNYRDRLELSPMDLQVGVSKRLKYLPFRFTVIAHSLHRWNLSYDSALDVETDIFGEVLEESTLSKEVDNFFRHFIFNGEFLFGTTENFRLRIGYNHQRRKELSVSPFRSLSGFSFGFGLKVSKFRLDYGMGAYHLGGSANHLGISIDLNDFMKGKLKM